jgi:hypothetical protein
LRRVGNKPSPRQDVFSTVTVLTTNEPKKQRTSSRPERSGVEGPPHLSLLLPLPVLPTQPRPTGSPILRAFAKGGNQTLTSPRRLFNSPRPNNGRTQKQRTSSRPEGSGVEGPPHLSLLLLLPVLPTQPRPTGCPILRAFCEGWETNPHPRQDVFSTVPVRTTDEPKKQRTSSRPERSGVEGPPHLSLLLPLPVLPTQPRPTGCPILRAFAKGGNQTLTPPRRLFNCPRPNNDEPKNNGRHFDRSLTK